MDTPRNSVKMNMSRGDELPIILLGFPQSPAEHDGSCRGSHSLLGSVCACLRRQKVSHHGFPRLLGLS